MTTNQILICNNTELSLLNKKIIESFKERFPDEKKIKFSERNTVVSDQKDEFNIEDDEADKMNISNSFKIQTIIYQRTMDNLRQSLKELKKENLAIERPADFMAEMFKSDKHMNKIKKRLLLKQKEAIKREQKSKNKLQKRFNKIEKHKKNIEQAKEKKKNLEAISNWKTSIKNKEGKKLSHFLEKRSQTKNKKIKK